MLVPFWVAPMSRLVAGQPAAAATFSYPSPSQAPGEGAWTWTIERRHKLEIRGRLASPQVGHGPRLGSWEKTVDYFRNRRRGYAMWENRLRAVSRASHPAVAIWPLAVEIGDAGLLSECLTEVPAETWQAPHSAWLCPEIPFNLELEKPVSLPLPAGRVAAEGGW